MQNLSDKSDIDVKPIDEACKSAKEKFIKAMDDDFNTSLALAEVFELVGILNSAIGNSDVDKKSAKSVQSARDLIAELMGVFGIEFGGDKKDDAEFDAIAQKLNIKVEGSAEASILKVRAEARANKDFELADKIRDALSEAGYTIEDTPQGSRIV